MSNEGKGGIVRIEHDRERPYVLVSKGVSECSAASWGLRGMLTYLLGKQDGWTIWMEQLESQAPDGREMVRSLFREGRALGFIKTVTWREKGRIQFQHTVYERPLATPCPDIVDRDSGKKVEFGPKKKAVTKKPSTASRLREAVNGSPVTVSRPLISNDEVSNDQQINTLDADASAAPSGEGHEEQTEPQGGGASAVTSQSAPDGAAPDGAQGTPSQVEEQQSPAPVNTQATGTEQVPGAAAAADEGHQAMFDALWEAVKDIRATGKEKVVGRKAKEALAAGFTPADARAAVKWGAGDPWWQTRLVPSRLCELLTAWDAERRTPTPSARPAPAAPAPAATPGKPRRIF